MAEVTSVTIDYRAPFGTYGDLTYTYIEATMNGTVDRPDPEPDGNYSVGIMMIYPETGGNGIGLVDWPNSVFFHYYGFQFCPRYMYPLCEGVDGDTQHRLEDTYIRFSRLTLEDYMWEQGYTWMAVSWDKTVTDIFGETIQPGRHNRLIYGTIERGTDGPLILQDAARFMRDMSAFEGETPPRSTDTVISMAFSQSAMLQNQFLIDGLNVETDGSLVYDAFYIQMVGFLCWLISDEPPVFEGVQGGYTGCSEVPEGGDAKVMRVATQSETDFMSAALSRGEGIPNLIQYELPGVAHLAPPVFDVSWVGGTRSNPADPRPFMRGALNNLTEWVVNGTEPPPTVYIEGTVSKSGAFTPEVDADGNALGGIRLPHMPSVIDGQPAGAPTGLYGAIDSDGLAPFNLFKIFGGSYTRFSDEDLAARYPTPEAYRELVTRSADKLLADGYITQKDRDAYANGPADLPDVPDPPDDGGEDDGGATDDGGNDAEGGCSVGSSSPGWAAVLALLACLPLVRRRRASGGVRLLAGCLALAISLPLMAGCYGDVEPTDDGVGAECRGHTCPNAPINLPEGGEVRLEYVYQKDAELEIRSSSWFSKAQTPESRPWPRPPADWNLPGAVVCGDMTTNTIWPSGDPDTRTYADVGEWVRYVGGGQEFQLPKVLNAQDDALNNIHDIGYVVQLMPEDVPVDTDYDVVLAGGADVEAKTYESALYLPPDYEVTFPNMQDTVLVPLGEDFPLLWDAPENVDDYEFAFVSFGDQVDPMIYCIGPNSGSMEIPADLIAQLPPAGQILHGVFSHRVDKLNEDRRLDFLGINCRLSQYVITNGEL